ncbi:MAG: hypothetical protein A3C36_01780 [Omnitrophica WOR_2 bacterium RIFCSPHIGHO2_02_FULL_52_10]|nr:MAG: hypothetical protein A3C36_01780 [Omnitrophica WOR_2 bacterium RIFCSPHIGHO2_02_FULL_52_10]
MNFFSIEALRGRFSFLRESLSAGALKKFLFDIKGLNRVLRICIIVLAVYLVGYFAMALVRMNEAPEFENKSSRASAEYRPAGLSTKNVAFYLEGPRARNIFTFGDITKEKVEELKTEEVAAPVEVTETPAAILAGQLGLVGIGWSDDPDVMVENVETKKMHFLKKGQRIDGMIKVEAIFEDKVILTYDNGKELELR